MGSAKYIGRIGALAVALGIGTAITAGPAGAAPPDSTSNSSAGTSHKSDNRHHTRQVRDTQTHRSPTAAAKHKSAATKKREHPRPAAASETARATETARAADAAPVAEKPVAKRIEPPALTATSTAPVPPPLTAVAVATTTVVSQLDSTSSASDVGAVLSAVSSSLNTGTGVPADSPANWVMLAAARRELGVPTPTAATVAASKNVTMTTITQLQSANAQYGGLLVASSTLSGVANTPDADASWTVASTYMTTMGDFQSTVTYTTPYSQNSAVQTTLKSEADLLHLSYDADNYTAWLIAVDPANSSAIIGGKKLTLGYSIDRAAHFLGETNTVDSRSFYVEVLPSNIVPVFPGGDITAPKAPTVSTSSTAPSKVVLTISGGTDDVAVTGYNVYRIQVSAGGDQLTATAKANSALVSVGQKFTDTALTPDTNYVYTARAVDAAGNESLDSVTLSVITPAVDLEPPTVPTGLTASNITATSVTLKPTGGTDNVGVVGYNIYRDDVQVNDDPVAVGASFVDTVSPATTYTYTARAVDAADNESAPSAPTVVTTKVSTGNDGGTPGGDGDGSSSPGGSTGGSSSSHGKSLLLQAIEAGEKYVGWAFSFVSGALQATAKVVEFAAKFGLVLGEGVVGVLIAPEVLAATAAAAATITILKLVTDDGEIIYALVRGDYPGAVDAANKIFRDTGLKLLVNMGHRVGEGAYLWTHDFANTTKELGSALKNLGSKLNPFD